MRQRVGGNSKLREEMQAAALGKTHVAADMRSQRFESLEALVRLLTPENRQLLAIIRDSKPKSIAELATISGRAAPNLTRTLAKLEAIGFVKMEIDRRRRVPTAIVYKLFVEVDPFSLNDRLEIAVG